MKRLILAAGLIIFCFVLVGAVAAVPIKQWRRVGGKPYQGTWQWAIDNFSLPENIRKQVKENIRQRKFRWLKYGLQSGQVVNQVTFGRKEIWENVLTAWPESKAYAARDYGTQGYHVVRVLWCGNWAWWKEEVPLTPPPKPPSPVKPAPAKASLSAQAALPPVPTVPIFPAGQAKITSHNKFDLYLGGGFYENEFWPAQGFYFWSLGRWRPFEWSLGKDLSLALGVFGFGAAGRGDDRAYLYGWSEFAFGPTFKLWGGHWDVDLDPGIGRLWNKGGIDHVFGQRQEDTIFRVSAHANFYSRRDKGEKWFPKTEIDFVFRQPLSSHRQTNGDGRWREAESLDQRLIGGAIRQAIYDFKIGQHWRITPALNLGFGREFVLGKNYLQVGPAITVASYNEDIFSLSFLNFKEQLGGGGDQWHWLSGYLSIGGVIRAIKASQIKEASAQDLVSPFDSETGKLPSPRQFMIDKPLERPPG